MPEWIGKTIGKVRIEKYLARGGMAEVYLGTHLTLERPVAVKVMHSFIEADPDLLMRFQREAKVVAGLRHANIVQIFDFDTADGHPYIVMEYLKGPSLAQCLLSLHEKNRRLPLDQVARLLKELGSALAYAHALGAVHRDIKPGNVILHASGNELLPDGTLASDTSAILTDFGLVRIAAAHNQTATGAVSGTPAYMSPEQARGDKVDLRSDIYSLGVALYEMLAGRVPFDGDSTMAVILKHLNEPPPPIEGIAPALQNVIDVALAKNPNQRYQSTLEMVAAFQRAVGQTTTAPTISISNRTFPPRPATVSKSVSAPAPAAVPVPAKKKSTSPVLIGVAVSLFACLAIVVVAGLGLVGMRLLSSAPNNPGATQAPMSGYGMSLNSLGVLRFQDGTAAMDQITISAKLPAPISATQYEAWLISDSGEQRRSLGLLKQDASGQFTLAYVDPQSHNLLDGWSRMEISIEPLPDNSPNPSGQVAFSSAIPNGSLMHIRHLLVAIDETPNKIGMAEGLVRDTTLIKSAANGMLAAHTTGDAQNVKANAEAIINLIVGNQDGASYKDWDGDGTINDPGDGYGLLLNGSQAGYIGGVIDHAKLAGNASDSTAQIRVHTEHVTISAQNVETWTTKLRDIAMRLTGPDADPNEDADVRAAVTLANQMLDGIDINGNETVDPIPGEGGAITAYEHSDYMADMPILAGKDQMPPTGK